MRPFLDRASPFAGVIEIRICYTAYSTTKLLTLVIHIQLKKLKLDEMLCLESGLLHAVYI